MSTPPTTPPVAASPGEPKAARPERSLLGRLLAAQESGLVLVIGLLMAALTLFGGTKERVVRLDVAPGATVTETADAIVIRTESGTQTYPAETWSLRGPESARFLMTRVEVNRFFEKENLVLLTNNASYFAVMAVGMTAIIILAGIDLSIGSIFAVAALLGGLALAQLDAGASAWVAVPLALAVCCTVGSVLGGLNGAMSVGLRIHPFIVTLGTMAVYRGAAFLLTRGQTVSGLPDSIQTGFFKLEYSGIYPVNTAIMVLVAVAGTVVLSATVFGRRIYAIGGNETAARYAGIPVGRVKITVYALTGLLVGLAACMQVGYLGTATSDAGKGYELNVIAAAVIGGASLSGGRGSALGAVLGAILVGIIDNAIVILRIDQNWNQIVMGAAIILAVAVDQFKARFVTR